MGYYACIYFKILGSQIISDLHFHVHNLFYVLCRYYQMHQFWNSKIGGSYFHFFFVCMNYQSNFFAVFFLHWYWFWTCSAHLNKLVVHFLCKCVQPCSLVFFLLELFPWMIYPSSFSIFYYICPMGASVCFNLLSSTFKDDKSNYVDHAIMDSHHVSHVLGLCGCVYRCCLTGSVSSSCMFQRNHIAFAL